MGADDSIFEEQCLQIHNELRSQHGVHPLKLNRRMCREAKDWAKTLAAKEKMEHKPNIPYGENIFSCWSSNPSHVITGKNTPLLISASSILIFENDFYHRHISNKTIGLVQLALGSTSLALPYFNPYLLIENEEHFFSICYIVVPR